MDNDLGIRSLMSLKTLISITAILIILNLVYLDILAFKNAKVEVQKETVTVAPIIYDTASSNQACPNSCLNQIYQATASSKISSQNITPTKNPAPIPTTITTSSQTKEFYIPLGSGTNSSEDWQDVAGIKASIDSANYSSIKSVIFEASVHIPTGNQVAFVRLFNETDKHPVWFSDVSLEGGTPQLLISKSITLDSGNKVYKVQMKTSLKYQAILDQARVHITTN